MGAWEADTLSNDAAQDFLIEVEESTSPVSLISGTLRKAIIHTEDEALGESAVAGAEIVASALGRSAPHFDEARRWRFDGDPFCSEAIHALTAAQLDELRELALRAVTALREDSSLRRLWEDARGLQAWLASLDDLVSRLH